jgi:hypothetical protein
MEEMDPFNQKMKMEPEEDPFNLPMRDETA